MIIHEGLLHQTECVIIHKETGLALDWSQSENPNNTKPVVILSPLDVNQRTQRWQFHLNFLYNYVITTTNDAKLAIQIDPSSSGIVLGSHNIGQGFYWRSYGQTWAVETVGQTDLHNIVEVTSDKTKGKALESADGATNTPFASKVDESNVNQLWEVRRV